MNQSETTEWKSGHQTNPQIHYICGLPTNRFFFYPEHPSFVGRSSCPHQDRPVVEKLSHSRGVGPQTLGAQCGTYFGADEEGRCRECVFGRVGMKVRNEMSLQCGQK